MASRGWIGVDLDGTLAYYEHGSHSDELGEPIIPMLERIKRWLSRGYEVRIVTARVSSDGSISGDAAARYQEALIDEYITKHVGRPLRITCMKDYDMLELWDDRAVQVEANTGRRIGHSTRGLE